MMFADSIPAPPNSTPLSQGGIKPRPAYPRGADFQSAVSQVSNLRTSQKVREMAFHRSADWKSATQQVGNLRHKALKVPSSAVDGSRPENPKNCYKFYLTNKSAVVMHAADLNRHLPNARNFPIELV